MAYDPLALYAHFLDRELRESVNLEIDFQTLLEYVTAGCIISPSRVYCSYSHLWESGYSLPNQLDSLRPMLDADLLYPISDYSSGIEFLESRRRIYNHDQARYPMYFDAVTQKTIHSVDPKFRAVGSTTQILHENLEGWSKKSDPSRSEIEKRAARIVEYALKERDVQAITNSYFRASGAEDMAALQVIRREISKAYVRRYLDTCHGDILTGIRGLQIYDELAIKFPVYDTALFSSLWKVIFGDTRALRTPRGISKLVAFRLGPSGREISGSWAALIAKLVCSLLPEDRHLPQVLCRDMLAGRLQQLGRKYSNSSEVNGELLLDRINIFCVAVESQFGCHSYSPENTLKFVIMIATDTEQKILLERLASTCEVQSIGGQKFPLWRARVQSGADLYVVRTGMGQLGQLGSIITTVNVLDNLKPDFFLMAGICMGFKKGEHEMCDNIVAERIVDSASGKIGPTQVEHRGTELQADSRLLAAARQVSGTAKAHFGTMLVGTNVVNNPQEVRRLAEQYPRALGLEMEGHGVASVCVDRGVPFLLTKAICDWGFDKADGHQEDASANSVAFALRIVQIMAGPCRALMPDL